MEIEDLICYLKQTGEKEDYETSIKLEKILEENEQLKQGIIPSYEETIMELEKEIFENFSKIKLIKEKIQELHSYNYKSNFGDVDFIYKTINEANKILEEDQ